MLDYAIANIKKVQVDVFRSTIAHIPENKRDFSVGLLILLTKHA